MTIRAIIKQAQIENAVRLWSRHATPRAFTHICLSGIGGKKFFEHIDPTATGLFVPLHPTLGDWDALAAEWKTPSGKPIHQFGGMTKTSIADPEFTWSADRPIDLFVLGHLTRFVNGKRRDGGLFVGIEVDDATLLDSIKPAGIAYRSDTGNWSTVSDQYKRPNGQPRVDPTTAQKTALGQREVVTP